MGKWFPYIYDSAMKGLEASTFKNIRAGILQKANGRVLEIGSGSGINFPFYREVESVDAVEPSPYMNEKAKGRLLQAKVPIRIHQQAAEALTFQDNTFDTVIATLVFCTIPEPSSALKEISRVAKNDAKFLLFEHVKMPQPALAKAQTVLTPFWKKICDGCHLDRETLPLLEEQGIRIDAVHTYCKGLFVAAECTIIK